MKKIAVLVSGGGTNLQALLDAQARGEIINGEISLVISSQDDAYALVRAKNANVETKVIVRKGKKRDTFTREIIKCLDSHAIDLVIFAGFMCIVDESLCKAYENRIINVHPALIPSFCGEGYYGLLVHEKALEYGVKVTGATIHFVSPITDGGPIIAQRTVNVREDDTPETLQRRVMEECEWKLLPEAASLFCQDKLKVEGRKVTILD